MTTPIPDRHLDLGCGDVPRNPYGRGELCGVDIQVLSLPEIDYRGANLSIQPIPFPENYFGSVSAFDFIEHVPRILPTTDGRSTRFPFIELMNEIWRVLAPGGLIYAITPAFPDPDAFVDPTHVNIITDQTHTYFCSDAPKAAMYGFTGRYEARRVLWVHGLSSYDASQVEGSPDRLARLPSRHTGAKGISRELRTWLRQLRGRTDHEKARRTSLLWEFEAVKPSRKS